MKDLPREEPQTCLANIFPPLPGYMRGGKEEMFRLLRMHLLGVPKGRQVEKGTPLTSPQPTERSLESHTWRGWQFLLKLGDAETDS